jgi:beta-lactamase regulating signal transducer with metallopeptidase domain
MNTTIITSWLLTYLVHSTILLGAAWLASRLLADRRLALQETLLRTALIGGLLTTTLQVGVGVEPIGGALAIDGLTRPDAGAAVSARNDGVTTSAATPNIALSIPPSIPDRVRGFWPIALLSLWGCGSLLALLVVVRSVLDLRHLLKTRRFRPAGGLVKRLAAAMGLRRPVRLSTSAAIAVPFATGIRRLEICCPERADDLAREHRTSLFAHELAHLARRDPAWQLLYRLGEALFVLQPLNRLVRRRLEEIAEHLTDERAVACTGDRLGLARCLVVVAHWGFSSRLGLPATAFAAGPRLDRRVKRLISGTTNHGFSTQWAVPLVIALLAGAVSFLPTVGARPVHAELTGSPLANTTTWNIYAEESGSGYEIADRRTWSLADDRPADSRQAPGLPEPAPAPAPVLAPGSADACVGSVEPAPAVAPVLAKVPFCSAEPASAMAPVLAKAPAAAVAPPLVPVPAVAPVSEAAPAPAAAPALAGAPTPRDEPAPPASPATPKPPPRIDEPTPEAPARSRRERTREEATDRQRESQRERSEAEAGERARALSEEGRAHAEQARELAREAAESTRLTDAEREKLRSEAREHARAAAERAREMAEQSRQLAREAAQHARLTNTEREEFRRHAEELRSEARGQAREAAREATARARELSEKARLLAEEAEAERRAEKERRRREYIE